jgi:hypothetical protein
MMPKNDQHIGDQFFERGRLAGREKPENVRFEMNG